MSSSSPEFEARQLILPRPLHTQYPLLSSLLYDSHSNSLAFRHFDSSLSLYPSFNPLCISSFPSPQTLIPSPTSSAAFLRLQTSPNSTTTLFITSSPIIRPSSATLFRFFVLRDGLFGKIGVFSNHRDLEFDRTRGGVVFNVNHGVSMKLSGGINVFSLYSVSNAKIWVFSVRLVGDNGGGETLKLMKCAVIDCCFPVFDVRVLFGYLILGEENGVRVFPLQPLVKGNQRKEKRNSGKRLNFQNGLSNGPNAAKVSDGGKVMATDGDLNLLTAKGEKNEKNTGSVTQATVTQVILTSDKIQDIVPMAANAILTLGQGSAAELLGTSAYRLSGYFLFWMNDMCSPISSLRQLQTQNLKDPLQWCEIRLYKSSQWF